MGLHSLPVNCLAWGNPSLESKTPVVQLLLSPLLFRRFVTPQTSRLPCPSPSPRACSNLCPLSWWCPPTILSSVVPFSSYLQSFPASGPFLMSLCRATQDGWVMVESFDKTWSTGEGNDKPLQYSCLENSKKRQKDRKLKDNSPGW